MIHGQQNSNFGKTKLDRRNFIFVNQSGKELIKNPGDINGQAFKVEDLTDCTIWLLDHFAQVLYILTRFMWTVVETAEFL